jgi:hypothetical protein
MVNDKRILWALVASTLIHAIFFITVRPDLVKSEKTPVGIKTKSSVEVKLLPREISKKTPVESKGTDPILPPVQTDRTICTGQDKNYEGVGIIYNGDKEKGTGVIMLAPEYYPGYRAGLRVGDYIVNMPLFVQDGHIKFEIMRFAGDGNSYRIVYNIKIERICYSGPAGAGLDK